jgi:hypothetical protein
MGQNGMYLATLQVKKGSKCTVWGIDIGHFDSNMIAFKGQQIVLKRRTN